MVGVQSSEACGDTTQKSRLRDVVVLRKTLGLTTRRFDQMLWMIVFSMLWSSLEIVPEDDRAYRSKRQDVKPPVLLRTITTHKRD